MENCGHPAARGTTEIFRAQPRHRLPGGVQGRHSQLPRSAQFPERKLSSVPSGGQALPPRYARRGGHHQGRERAELCEDELSAQVESALQQPGGLSKQIQGLSDRGLLQLGPGGRSAGLPTVLQAGNSPAGYRGPVQHHRHQPDGGQQAQRHLPSLLRRR